MPIDVTFEFYRKRVIAEKGLLTIQIDNVSEEEIQKRLDDKEFKKFLITQQEDAAEPEWAFVPVIRNAPRAPDPQIA